MPTHLHPKKKMGYIYSGSCDDQSGPVQQENKSTRIYGYFFAHFLPYFTFGSVETVVADICL